jgi:hypothetical protein
MVAARGRSNAGIAAHNKTEDNIAIAVRTRNIASRGCAHGNETQDKSKKAFEQNMKHASNATAQLQDMLSQCIRKPPEPNRISFNHHKNTKTQIRKAYKARTHELCRVLIGARTATRNKPHWGFRHAQLM